MTHDVIVQYCSSPPFYVSSSPHIDVFVYIYACVYVYIHAGCGKTLLAHAIAGELQVPFLSVAAPELIGGTSGDSERSIRDLFEQVCCTCHAHLCSYVLIPLVFALCVCIDEAGVKCDIALCFQAAEEAQRASRGCIVFIDEIDVITVT